MSRRRPGSQPQKTIQHPNDPSISVVVRKPKRAEFEHLQEMLQPYRTVRPVKDGEVTMKNEDGSDKLFIDQFVPREANIERLSRYLVSWSGVLGEGDSPLPLAGNIGELYESWLDCEVDSEGKKESISFGQYIDRQLGKDGFFDPDPTVSDSAPS